MALATFPSIPGRWLICTRRVRLYWALGVLAIWLDSLTEHA